MSDLQLKSEIENIIKRSGYDNTKELRCPIIRIVTMRYRDMPRQQVLNVIKTIF